MDEFITVSLKKMSAGSIYKILLIGLTCSLVPLGLLNGILAAVGVNLLTLRWNGEAVHGFRAIIISPIFCFILALVLTGIVGSLAWLGLWIYGQFRPLTLRISSTDRG